MASANLYRVTKFPLYLLFTVHYFNIQSSSFTQFYIHTNCFGLFLSAHFQFWEILNLNLTFVFAVYVKRKLSIYWLMDRWIETADPYSTLGYEDEIFHIENLSTPFFKQGITVSC